MSNTRMFRLGRYSYCERLYDEVAALPGAEPQPPETSFYDSHHAVAVVLAPEWIVRLHQLAGRETARALVARGRWDNEFRQAIEALLDFPFTTMWQLLAGFIRMQGSVA